VVTLHDESPNTLVRCKRFAHALLHLVRGMATTLIVYPFCNQAQRAAHVREWCAQLLYILNVRVHVEGTPPGGSAVPMMIVANHVSWLDILAINAVRTVRFVGKAEIRRWPALGWLCANNGTLFIERERRHHPARINALVVSAMRNGDIFAVFPEGRTTSGDRLLPFHASLLEPAIDCQATLWPVALRYTRADGSLCSEADYEGEKSLVDSLRLILTQRVINMDLQFLAPIDCAHRNRRELAQMASAAIASALALPAPRQSSGKASRPRV